MQELFGALFTRPNPVINTANRARSAHAEANLLPHARRHPLKMAP